MGGYARFFLRFGAAVLGCGCLAYAPGCGRSLGGRGGSDAPVGTAGQPGSPQFADMARAAGLNYRWEIPGKRPLNILQTIGNGCAFLDYDNDGFLDILLVGPKLALYKGDGHGHFTDVTAATGLDKLTGHFLGCAVGDYDNDGYDDVYISGYQTGLLLHNEDGKRFKDVTKEAGLKPQPWGTSCAFVDIDGDGLLDLYIGNYVRFGPNTQPRLCRMNNVLSACGPKNYKPEKGVLYRNLGGGKFSDVTAAWGAQNVTGKALGVACADFDGSGRQSLAVANDGVPGDLLENQGGRFKNIAKVAGTAYDRDGNLYGGMGTDWGDYDNDGRLDLAVATFVQQAKCLFHNDGNAFFSERSDSLGIGEKTLPYIAFGVKFFDFDNDGWLDLILANGHVQDNIADIDKAASYRQPIQLFRNVNGTAFEDISAQAGAALQNKIVGRGLAVGDFDNDGKMDALVVDSEGAPLLLHNETQNAGHWLLCRLVGVHCNRDGLGALIRAQAGDKTYLRRCATDGSYLSASDKRMHIGLGPAQQATLTVQWPDGHKDVFPNVPADRIVTLQEGAHVPQ